MWDRHDGKVFEAFLPRDGLDQGQERFGGNEDGRDTQPLELDGVVDTPRRAGASVTDPDDGGVEALELHDHVLVDGS